MPLPITDLNDFVKMLLLSTGLACSLAYADEPVERDEKPSSSEVKSEDSDSAKDAKQSTDDDTVEIRISLPDGRVIIRREPAKKHTAKRHFLRTKKKESKELPDGSRISFGISGVSGGSSSSSTKTLGSSGSSGGGGSSGGSSGSGSGGGSASSGGGHAARPSHVTPDVQNSDDVDPPTDGDTTPQADPVGSIAIDNRAPTGTNLGNVNDYSPSWFFVDIFKSSREWMSGNTIDGTWDDQRPIATDSDGWVTSLLPGQKAHTLMRRSLDGQYPTGRYVCLYEGTGTIKFYFNAKIVSSTPGRIEFDVTSPDNAGIGMSITETDSQDYVRNIRVILPGFEDKYEDSLFHPDFIESLATFNTLRMMDWQRTNNAPVYPWSERSKPSNARYSSEKGVPIEIMVDLCNEINASPWFCMAHGFDDNYIDQFATLVDEHLNQNLKVYVEHSNEVWNRQFDQHDHALSQASLRDIPGDNAFEQSKRYHSERSVEIFDIWDDHFSSQELVRVMGGWHGSPRTTGVILNWNKAYEHTDAFAIAPYFGGYLGASDNPIQTIMMSPDEIIDACIEHIASQSEVTRSHHEHTSEHSIDLIAYESGQHLVGVRGNWSNNETFTDLLIATNRHPRMYDAYTEDITKWHEAGGGLMMSFNSCAEPSKHGSWGLIEYQNQPLSEAHKMRAIIDYNLANAEAEPSVGQSGQ